MRALLVLCLWLLAPWAGAQTPEEDRAALEEARAKLEAVPAEDSEEASDWREAYQVRIRLLEELLATAQAQESLPSSEELAERRDALKAELEDAKATLAPTEVTLESAEDLGPYEQDAKTKAAARVSAQSALDAVKTKRAEAEAELAALSDRSEAATRRAEAPPGEDEAARYAVESARLEARVISARATYLTAGLGLWELEEEVRRLELDLITLQAGRSETLAGLAEVEATRLRELEAERARREAESEARRAERESDPIERFRLRARSEAGHLRAEAKDFEGVLLDLRNRLAAEEALGREVTSDREGLDQRLEVRQRRIEDFLRQHLDRTRRSQSQISDVLIPAIDLEGEGYQIEQAEILDRQWSLSLPAGENLHLKALLAEVASERSQEAEEAFRRSQAEDGLVEALRLRADQLESASKHCDDLLKALKNRRSKLAEYEDYILGQMLWTQSEPPLDARAFATAWSEIQSLPGPYRSDGTWGRLRENLGTRFPVLLLLAGALAVLAFGVRRVQAWPAFGASRAPAPRFALRLGGGLLWAAGPALGLWASAWAVFALGGPEAFDPPLTTFLIYQGAFVLTRRAVRLLLGEDGLLVGEHAFPPAIGLQLTRNLRLLTLAGQALYAPYLVLAGKPFEFEILPRLFFTAWIVAASVAVLGLVRRNGALVQNWTVEGGLLRPVLRFVWVVSALALFPVLALDIKGFRVGAERTLVNGLKIFTTLFVLGALFRVLERIGAYWADRAAHADSLEDEQLIHARGAAIRALVRVGAYIIVIMCALVLKDSMGIGGVLSKFLADQNLVQVQEDPVRYLTGWNLVQALLWLAGGHLIASNLRQLHEGLVAPFVGTSDEGSQYAFLTILRYLVIAVTYAAALLTLGFSFEALGWFATAASVGLGFGLQEIVANFISGLILLFERPIRVGDIVTIGQTSGKIESISMRATVITNWERQTIIVPNKKFVTEDLTNWTRADKIMRRDLDVRVAYGTDVERVLALLTEIVRGHPAVLEEPASKILFQNFGVVGLEFRVLFYTPIDQGLSTRSEIHARILERFAAEGIEIPTVRFHDELQGGPGPAKA